MTKDRADQIIKWANRVSFVAMAAFIVLLLAGAPFDWDAPSTTRNDIPVTVWQWQRGHASEVEIRGHDYLIFEDTAVHAEHCACKDVGP